MRRCSKCGGHLVHCWRWCIWGRVAFLILAATMLNAPAGAQVGSYSFEQECRTGTCPDTAGPASCVAIGHHGGGTVILTAAHCVRVKSNRFLTYGPDRGKVEANLYYFDDAADVALLVTKKRLPKVGRLSRVKPQTGDKLTIAGVLSRKLVKDSGKVTGWHNDHYGRLNGRWEIITGRKADGTGNRMATAVWSHPGCSGCGLYNAAGEVVAIQSGKDTATGDAMAASLNAISRLVDKLEAEHGPIERVAKVTHQQASYGNPRRTVNIVGGYTCGKPNCPNCNGQKRPCIPQPQIQPVRPVPPVQPVIGMAQVCVGVNHERVADMLYSKYGDKLRGATGPAGSDGAPGGTPSVDLRALAALLATEHADQLRGATGETGQTGATGNTGPAGPQGGKGLSIQKIFLTDDSHLVITYTNGTADRVGPIVSQPGPSSVPAYFDIVPKRK